MNKKLLITAIVVVFFITFSFGQNYTRFKTKSGMIEYKMTGTVSGKTTLYWDDYGYKTLNIHESKTIMMGMTRESNYKELTVGAKIYTWDDANDYVTESTNPFAEQWEDENFDKKDFDKFNQESLESLGYKKVGEEKVQSKKCEVWEGIGKIWVWNEQGISMKTEVNALGTKSLIEVTDMDLNKKVKKDLFKYPKDKNLVVEEPDMDNEEIDPETMQQLMKGFNMRGKDHQENVPGQGDEQPDAAGQPGLEDELKKAAKEGAKEGAKEAAKEETKEASKKAAKKLLKSLFD